MLLYDNNTKTYSSNIVRYIAPGETLTLSQLGLHATFISSGTMTQVLVWTSGNSSCVSVNAATGTITGVNPGGSTTITVSQRSGGIIYSKSYTIHVTLLQEGTYFMRSKSSYKHVDIENNTMANDTAICQWNFHGGNTQRWVMTHLGNGSYSIKSANSSSAFYLGVKNDSTSYDQPIVLRTGPITDGMKWKVSLTSSGAYKFTPLTGEDNDYVLALDDGIMGIAIANGDTLQQRHYVDDTNYRDEWVLHLQKDYSLMFIGYSEGDEQMPIILNSIENVLINTANLSGYGETSMTMLELAEHLASSNIYACITHGSQTSIKVSDGSFTVDNVNDFSANALDNLTFVYLGACKTGLGGAGANNLVNALASKGVNTVLGFKISVYVDETNIWTEAFMKSIGAGNTIAQAMDDADAALRADPSMEGRLIFTVGEENRYIVGSTSVAPCD